MLFLASVCRKVLSDIISGFGPKLWNTNDAKYPFHSSLLEPLDFDSTFPLNAQDAFENVSFQIACLRGGIITLHLSEDA